MSILSLNSEHRYEIYVQYMDKVEWISLDIEGNAPNLLHNNKDPTEVYSQRVVHFLFADR